MAEPISKEEIKSLLMKELELLKQEGCDRVDWFDEKLLDQNETFFGGKTEAYKKELLNRQNMIAEKPSIVSESRISTSEINQNEEKENNWGKIEPEPESSTKKPEEKPVIKCEIEPEETIAEIVLTGGSKKEQWNSLRAKVLSCPVCNRHLKLGKKLVFGLGNLDADIFFCGEAPGAEEEIRGEPFVGRAGQLLTKIIEATGLKRTDVYIGNIMNWRPEMPSSSGNRPPTQDEMECCLPYLRAQLQIVQPKVIVALGATAANGLLGYDSQRRMANVRGKWFTFANIPLMITYHPSYLLRNATLDAKRLVWEDFLSVMEFLHMPISDKQRAYFRKTATE